ncbi:MAG: hypothetical protein WBA42_23085 [Mesorhizobium sp.]
MTNWVANQVIATGADRAIQKLLLRCFPVGANNEVEFSFDQVIPLPEATEIEEAELCRQLWDTRTDAIDSTITFRGEGVIIFEFLTASNYPNKIYRALGEMFPELDFDIAAIEPGECWAVTGRIVSGKADFDENADEKAVYERVYKAPLEES